MNAFSPALAAPPRGIGLDLAHALANPARPDPLEPLRRLTEAMVRQDGRDLTARQMAVLLRVHLAPGPHTVRGLAADLGTSKPAISRALDVLGAMGLAVRVPDPADGRSILALPGPSGAAFVAQMRAWMEGAADA